MDTLICWPAIRDIFPNKRQMLFVFRGFFARFGTAARHAWQVEEILNERGVTNMLRYT